MEASNIRDILTSFCPSSDFLTISSDDGRIKLTKSKGEAIHSLLRLSGRLQLMTELMEKAANKSQPFGHDHELGAIEEDEEVEEVLYGEESEESQNTDDEDV